MYPPSSTDGLLYDLAEAFSYPSWTLHLSQPPTLWSNRSIQIFLILRRPNLYMILRVGVSREQSSGGQSPVTGTFVPVIISSLILLTTLILKQARIALAFWAVNPSLLCHVQLFVHQYSISFSVRLLSVCSSPSLHLWVASRWTSRSPSLLLNLNFYCLPPLQSLSVLGSKFGAQ